jgi:ketosteroid isomerase-like protein
MIALWLAAGALSAVAARALLVQALLAKFRHDLVALNAGDHRALLAGYADDAVLRVHEGPHRWAGEHRGKAAIDRFLRDFTAAGMKGDIRALWIAGPPWALRVVARFDDTATGPGGETLYANRTCLVVRTRWGKIIEHDDFYFDTGRIVEFERALTRLGIPRAPAPEPR